MFSSPEQFSATAKANFEAQLALINAFTTKAFATVEQIVDLNMTVAKTSIEESNESTKQLLAAKDPQEFFSLASAQAQPAAEKAVAYGRHVASIASSSQAEFTKAAETQIAEASRKVSELIEEASKNAPAGSENVISMVKSAMGNASAGYEQFTKTTKQAVEAIETNLNSAVTNISQASAKTSRAAKK